MIEAARSAASFRDPAGFVFRRDGVIHRQVNHDAQADYDLLKHSGLYRELTEAGLLIPHVETDAEPWEEGSAYRVIRPEVIPFVSYPFEWCFGAFRDAALLTLEVQRRAILAGMALKDASAYNIQFRGARPLLIDTLSFEAYREGEPWSAYRQFCQHFLAPLALMSLVDVRLSGLLRSHIDGIPLDFASRLLPGRTRFRFGLLVHIHLHAKLQSSLAKGTSNPARARSARFTRGSMLGLLDNLQAVVLKLKPPTSGPELGWVDYATVNSYSEPARAAKCRIVADYLDRVAPTTVWDLGANTGEYSRLASSRGAMTVSFDLDPACVEANYRRASAEGDARLLPLVADLVNPSPALGWHHRERSSLLDRGPADLVLALALVHHLAIANNVPLGLVAEFLAEAGRRLVIEFVPKDDPQAVRLLRARPDIFASYHQAGFEAAFGERFSIEASEPVGESGRTLYLMRRRDP